MTWLRISSDPAPCSPYSAVTMTAGMIAMSRVMSRRSQAGSRMSRNPSITIWPASVPVMVEFWPEASSATANSVLASVVPEQRRQEPVGVADVGHLLVAGLVERGGREDRGWPR